MKKQNINVQNGTHENFGKEVGIEAAVNSDSMINTFQTTDSMTSEANASKNFEKISVTIHSIVTKTIFVKIDAYLMHDDKVKLINDIALDIYYDETDNNNEDVYEKVHDVTYSESDDYDDYPQTNFQAIKNSKGIYELKINEDEDELDCTDEDEDEYEDDEKKDD
jgi:hypothetical protein